MYSLYYYYSTLGVPILSTLKKKPTTYNYAVGAYLVCLLLS